MSLQGVMSVPPTVLVAHAYFSANFFFLPSLPRPPGIPVREFPGIADP